MFLPTPKYSLYREYFSSSIDIEKYLVNWSNYLF